MDERTRSIRRLAVAAGVCFLITHVTSVAAPFLYGPLLSDAGYITGAGTDNQVALGVLLEVILAAAVVGTSVALFPVVKRQNEGIALGYVGLRTLEAAVIAAGVLPLIAILTLRREFGGMSGAEAAGLTAAGSALVAFYEATPVVGPGLVCGINTVLLAYLLFASRLVPRFIPVLGLIGGPIVFVFNAARLFGAFDPLPAWTALAVIPIFAWEVSLALRLIFRGFNLAAPAGGVEPAAGQEALSAA
jgi:hypothetical protein